LLGCQIHVPRTTTPAERDAHLHATAALISAQLTGDPADLVVLPELSSISYSRDSFDTLESLSEPLDGASFTVFSELARAHRCAVTYGIARRSGEKYFISQVVIDSSGEYVGHYDKLHTAQFGASMEKEFFHRGDHLLVFEVGGIRVAPVICYDFRFPELTRHLCLEHGVDLLLHPVAFYEDGSFPSWHHVAICRAIENQAYFLSLNRAGPRFGASIFCPPWVDQTVQPTVFTRQQTLQGFDVSTRTIKDVRRAYAFRSDRLSDYAGLARIVHQEPG
jgi:nitrilase